MSGGWLTAGRRLLMVLLLALILLRPEVGDPPAEAQRLDLEVLVVVDRTRSMAALDHGPDETVSRMEGVRADLRALTDALPGARFSVITFGAKAVTALPYSSDVTPFGHLVESLRPEGATVGTGSKVDRPLATMTEVLERTAQNHPDRQQALLFLSDGENTVPGDQRSFEALAELVDAGAVLGYGTAEGGRMPVADDGSLGQGYITDPRTGEDARSRLDEGNLRRIADQIGIDYVHRDSGAPIEPVAADIREDALPDAREDGRGGELTWILGLALLALGLVELRGAWRGLLVTRRAMG